MKVVPEAGAGEEQSREYLFVFVTLATVEIQIYKAFGREKCQWAHVIGTLALNSQIFKCPYFTSLNTERSYERQGHAPLKHFVGFPCNESQNNGRIT